MPNTKNAQTKQSDGQPIVRPSDQQNTKTDPQTDPKKANSDGQPIVRP